MKPRQDNRRVRLFVSGNTVFRGFSSISSYKNVTDFQINKKEGIYDVEAMRKNQLFSAAFNMNNKTIGKEVMRRAEELNLISEKQSGFRKK